MSSNKEKSTFPAQHQNQQPGLETKMHPRPISERYDDPSQKLLNKVAIITGGDSGIGKAVALAFAKQGAHIAILYLNEHEDAEKTKLKIEECDRRCLTIAGDISDEKFCQKAIDEIQNYFGHINILINNAAEQHVQEDFLAITSEQLIKTFQTNIFSMFYLTQAVLPHLKAGDTIINTTSVTAYRGSKHLIDYSSTKGAIVSFTRSLASNLVEKGIRVNGVAPGPIWTPLIPATFPAEHMKEFGENTPMERAGEPDEVAPCYVFLASRDSSYMTGQVLHPNGGEAVGS